MPNEQQRRWEAREAQRLAREKNAKRLLALLEQQMLDRKADPVSGREKQGRLWDDADSGDDPKKKRGTP